MRGCISEKLEPYGSLYDKYRAEASFFEVIQLVRRGVFGVISALDMPAQMQCIAAQFAITIQLVLHMRLDPYIDRNLNWVEFGLTATSLVLAQCGMIFSVYDGFERPLAPSFSYEHIMHMISAVFIVVSFLLAVVGLIHEMFEMLYIRQLRKHGFLAVDGPSGSSADADDVERSGSRADASAGPDSTHQPTLKYAPEAITAQPRPEAANQDDVAELYELAKRITYVSSLAELCSPLESAQDSNEQLTELLQAMRPYVDPDSGLSIISHKKKAKFWRAMVHLFPNVIDFLCTSKDFGQRGFIEGLNKFYYAYMSSEKDTDVYEFQHPRITTTHYQWIRPEHRAAVACFLASTSSRNRLLFEAVSAAACREPAGSNIVSTQVQRLYAFMSGAQAQFIPPERNHEFEDSIAQRASMVRPRGLFG